MQRLKARVNAIDRVEHRRRDESNNARARKRTITTRYHSIVHYTDPLQHRIGAGRHQRPWSHGKHYDQKQCRTAEQTQDGGMKLGSQARHFLSS
jgi:hypothetical protein